MGSRVIRMQVEVPKASLNCGQQTINTTNTVNPDKAQAARFIDEMQAMFSNGNQGVTVPAAREAVLV